MKIGDRIRSQDKSSRENSYFVGTVIGISQGPGDRCHYAKVRWDRKEVYNQGTNGSYLSEVNTESLPCGCLNLVTESKSDAA